MLKPSSKLRFWILSLTFFGLLVFSACSTKPRQQLYPKSIDNRHVFALLLQETLAEDSVSFERYESRILIDTAGQVPLVSVLYEVLEPDSIGEVRVLHAYSSLYAQDAIRHLKSTSKRSHDLGWHYQQWSFEVP